MRRRWVELLVVEFALVVLISRARTCEEVGKKAGTGTGGTVLIVPSVVGFEGAGVFRDVVVLS